VTVATGDSYTPTAADAGKTLTLIGTTRDAAGNVTWRSILLSTPVAVAPDHGPVTVKTGQRFITLAKGKSITVPAGAYHRDGTKVKVTYASSNKKIATVSAKGKVKAKKVGKVWITVKADSKTKKYRVNVVSAKAAKGVKVKSVRAVGVKTRLKVGAVKYVTGKYTPLRAPTPRSGTPRQTPRS
jgi:mannose-6-phosphate isomerase-like protein (cupin superfamily)